MTWEDLSPCRGRDPEIWFPPTDHPFRHRMYQQARQICRLCPVWAQCLELADKDGMWGGLTPRERSGKTPLACGHWITYRAGCRCPDCSEAHEELGLSS